MRPKARQANGLVVRIPRIAVAVVCLSFGSRVALACDCPPSPPPVPSSASPADLIFSGRATSRRPFGPASDGRDAQSFSVDRAWKGETAAEIRVVTLRSAATCGIQFELGKSYLVYAFVDARTALATADLCTRTRLMDDADADLLALGSPMAFVARSALRERLLALGAVVGALLIGLAVRRLDRSGRSPTPESQPPPPSRRG